MVNFINFLKNQKHSEKDNFLVNTYLSNLNNFYNIKNYKYLINEIQVGVLDNGFLTQDVKKKIIKNYNLNRKLMNIIKNYSNKLNRKRRCIINPKFLNLETTSNSKLDNNIIITEKNTNKIYLFTSEEMISIFKMSLLNQEESISYPSTPKNPYTNVKFTINEQIYIINKLNTYCYTNRKALHIVIKMYSESQYNPRIFSSIHANYLGIEACKNYIKSLNNENFNNLLKDFKKEYKLNRKICYKCLLKKYSNNLKTIFLPLIIKYQCENNDLYTGSISSIKMMLNTIRRENIKIEKRHYLKHRKRMVITGRKIVNVPSSITNSFQFTINQPLNFNFGNNVNNDEMFVFGEENNNTVNDIDNREELSIMEESVEDEEVAIEEEESVEDEEVAIEEEESVEDEEVSVEDEEESEDDEEELVEEEESVEDEEESVEDEEESVEDGEELEVEEEMIENNEVDNIDNGLISNDNSLQIVGRNIYNSSEYISDRDRRLRIRIPIVDILPEYDIEDRFSRLITNYNESNIYDITYNLEETFEEVSEETFEETSTDNIQKYLNNLIRDTNGIVEVNINDKFSLENFIINCPEKLHSKVTLITKNSKINGNDLEVLRKSLLNNILRKQKLVTNLPKIQNLITKPEIEDLDLVDYDEIEDEIYV